MASALSFHGLSRSQGWHTPYPREPCTAGPEVSKCTSKPQSPGACPALPGRWAAGRPQLTNHLLSLAEVDIFLAPSACPGVLDVHEADEGHGATAQQQDGEEHYDDGGGADELALLHGLQAQVQAQCIGDGPSET